MTIPRVFLEQLWWHNDHHAGAALHCDNPNCHAVGSLIATAVTGTPKPLPEHGRKQ